MSPSQVLKDAIRAVPAVRYALGVAGVAAAVAIVAGFRLDPRIAVFGTIIVFGMMFVLVVFGAAVAHSGPVFLPVAQVGAWCFLLLIVATAALLMTSYFFSWPRPLESYLPEPRVSRPPNETADTKVQKLIKELRDIELHPKPDYSVLRGLARRAEELAFELDPDAGLAIKRLIESEYSTSKLIMDIRVELQTMLDRLDTRRLKRPASNAGFRSGIPAAPPGVGITIDKIARNDEIAGTVTGLTELERANYKVIVYVKTDKWYIHPHSEGGDSMSWASIRADRDHRTMRVGRSGPDAGHAEPERQEFMTAVVRRSLQCSSKPGPIRGRAAIKASPFLFSGTGLAASVARLHALVET